MTNNQNLTWAEKEAKKDSMAISERGGEIVAVIGIALVAFFFYAHQAGATGFFTTSFGSTEAFFLYGSILTGMAGPLARIVSGRRNVARLPEIAVGAFWIAGSIWLIMVFPFDFARVGDVLPEPLRILTGWVTNDIARVLFILGTLGGLAFVPVNIILYKRVKKLLRH
jgi:hypothetical protein